MAASSNAALDLIKLFTGGGKNTVTSTESLKLTPEQLQAILKQSLESTQGLAAVSGGQKTAGLYNSTVNTQLTNDLLSRLTGEAAARSYDKTATQVSQTGAPMSKGAGLATLGAGMLWKRLDGEKKLMDILGSVTGSSATDAIFGEIPAITADMANNLGYSWFTDPAGGLMSDFSYNLLQGLGTDVATDVGSNIAAELGGETFKDLFSSFF